MSTDRHDDDNAQLDEPDSPQATGQSAEPAPDRVPEHERAPSEPGGTPTGPTTVPIHVGRHGMVSPEPLGPEPLGSEPASRSGSVPAIGPDAGDDPPLLGPEPFEGRRSRRLRRQADLARTRQKPDSGPGDDPDEQKNPDSSPQPRPEDATREASDPVSGDEVSVTAVVAAVTGAAAESRAGGPGDSSSATQAPAGAGPAATEKTPDAKAPPSRQRTPRREIMRRAVSVTVGLAALAGMGAVVTEGDRIHVGGTTPAVRTQAIAVNPSSEGWVCPRPATLSDTGSGGDKAFGSTPVKTSTALRAFAFDAQKATLSDLDQSDVLAVADESDPGVVTENGVTGSRMLTVRPSKSKVAGLSGASVGSITTAGDLTGLAAGTCQVPDVDAWLVGGATKIGNSTQLVVQNPGDTAATVSVSAWSQDGQVSLSSGAQLLVPPGKQVVSLIEAGAANASRLVVHVSSSGALVTSYLQHTVLDGLVPQGVDFVMPSAPASTSASVTGILSRGEGVDDPHAPQLRVLVPGSKAGTVDVTVYGPDGRVATRGLTGIRLDAGVVTDLSLGGLPAGTYAVAVTSTVPVVAGAFEERPGAALTGIAGKPYDRAYIPSTALSATARSDDDEARATATVPGTSSTVQIAAVPRPVLTNGQAGSPSGELTGKATVTVAGLTKDGKVAGTKEISVLAGTAVAVPASSLAKDADITVIRVTPQQVPAGLSLQWTTMAQAGPAASAGGSPSYVSVLLPSQIGASGHSVQVRSEPGIGLAQQ